MRVIVPEDDDRALWGDAGLSAEWTTACSVEAEDIALAMAELRRRCESSQGLFGNKLNALSGLGEVVSTCSRPDWNGEGADPIHPLAIEGTEKFIRALPDDLEMPEFAPEPDGSICLDWIESPRRVFSISVGTTDRLAFSWRDGTDCGHGVARFDGVRVPPRLLDGIKAIVRPGHVSFRPA